MNRKHLFAIFAALVLAVAAQAQPFLKLPALLSDGAVLQADEMVTLWGWCDPNTEVTVETSWGEKAVVKSDYSSLWKVRVKTPAATFDPQSVTVTTKRKVSRTVRDILIGQVWLCTGQSNMNWSAANGILDARGAVGESDPSVRLFTVPKKASAYPQEDIDGHWSPCDSASAWWFSAVGYFFGRKLAAEIGQPVGLVNASWGGTPVEFWIPRDAIAGNAEMVSSWNTLAYSRREGWDLGSAYNGMIAPLSRYAAAGAIWYQGEANRNNAELYAREFTLMIKEWRKAFGRELPFYFVQIAPKDYKGADEKGALVREQQEQVARTVPRTGMVNISDKVEDLTDIHPKYKKPVGERLAAYALAEVYGKPAGKYKSPAYASMEVRKNRVVVTLDNAEGGLLCRGGEIRGLEIGDGKNLYPAQGMIQGEKLVVWSNQVKKPEAVRYAFGLEPGNLTDTAGNPVLPFRSDAARPQVKAQAATPAPVPAAKPSNINTSLSGRVYVSCAGAEVRVLTENAPFFTNRPYPIVDVPAELSGLQFAAHEGLPQTETHTVKITAPEGGKVYVLARESKRLAPALSGWTPDRTKELRYTTKDPNKPGIMILWSRNFSKGETVTLSGVDFPGFTVVAPKIELQ